MSTGTTSTPVGRGCPAAIQLAVVRRTRTRTELTATQGGDVVHRDELNLASAAARRRFADAVAARSGHGRDEIERQMLAIATDQDESGDDGEEAAVRERPEYWQECDHEDPGRRGLYRMGRDGPEMLANACIEVVEDVVVRDDVLSSREFRCVADLDGTRSEFTIAAGNFANNAKILEDIYTAAGPRLQILCKPPVLRTAISAVSDPASRTVTTNFGWTPAGDAYLTPGVRIDAAGIHPVGPDEGVRVDLAAEQCARHLDLRAPAPGEIERLKRHFVTDFLRLHDRRVMYCLAAMAALAVLMRFVAAKNRFALWLVGLTGGGKSFVAKLAMNLFGDFPIQDGTRVGSWSSTANFLQRQGYFFKDALFLIDDYKKELTRHHEVIKIAQNYADGSARGRLNADATTNVSREICGLYIATGEDVPEHSASAQARSIVVPVPSRDKDVGRGRRCLEHRAGYPALMADFIRHLLAGGRTGGFAARVEHHQESYLEGIVGAQNDLRIAGNFALLAAAFEEIALYLGDAWPRSRADVAEFIGHDLVALRDEMLGTAREQQASDIILSTLAMLIANGRVCVSGYNPPGMTSVALEHRPVIGRGAGRGGNRVPRVFDIATGLALEAVQGSLQKQGRPPLPATPKALIDQLAAEGRLLGRDDRPIDPAAGGDRTWDARIGSGTRKSFRIAADALIGEAEAGTPGPDAAD